MGGKGVGGRWGAVGVRVGAAFAAALLLGVGAAAAEPSAWLARHRQPLDLSGSLALPAAFKGGRLLLLGEVHGLQHGQQLDLALLKAANAQAGVRFYLGEFDAVQAEAFNRLLDSGDTSAMDAVFAAWRRRGLQWANQDFRAKLLDIAAWNRSLPAARRIRFVGVDEVQDLPAFCHWLATHLPRQGATAALAEQARDPARCADGQALARVAAATRTQGLDARLREAIAGLAMQAGVTDREARIAANIQRHVRAHQAPAYGLWGVYHVVKAPVNGTLPMALQLARQGIDVRSIALLNLDGRMMMPVAREGGGIGWSEMAYTVDSDASALVNGIEDFVPWASTPFTLFPLRGRNSPFRSSEALTRVGGRLGQMQAFAIDPRRAVDGFWADAVILSRGSPATQPLPEP